MQTTTGLDASEYKQLCYPYRELSHDSSVDQPVAWSLYRLRYSGSVSTKNFARQTQTTSDKRNQHVAKHTALVGLVKKSYGHPGPTKVQEVT